MLNRTTSHAGGNGHRIELSAALVSQYATLHMHLRVNERLGNSNCYRACYQGEVVQLS